MRKLVLILIAIFAVVTFIRAFDNSAKINPAGIHSENLSKGSSPEIPESVDE